MFKKNKSLIYILIIMFGVIIFPKNAFAAYNWFDDKNNNCVYRGSDPKETTRKQDLINDLKKIEERKNNNGDVEQDKNALIEKYKDVVVLSCNYIDLYKDLSSSLPRFQVHLMFYYSSNYELGYVAHAHNDSVSNGMNNLYASDYCASSHVGIQFNSYVVDDSNKVKSIFGDEYNFKEFDSTKIADIINNQGNYCPKLEFKLEVDTETVNDDNKDTCCPIGSTNCHGTLRAYVKGQLDKIEPEKGVDETRSDSGEAVQSKSEGGKNRDIVNIESGGSFTCQELQSTKTYQFIKDAFFIIQIITPILLLVLGSLDFIRAIAAQNDDAMKKAQATFVKRLIITAIIVFAPIVLNLLFSFLTNVFDITTCGVGTQTTQNKN